jgi:ABC-type sulfate/molybdate transport systems ATPase subunit
VLELDLEIHRRHFDVVAALSVAAGERFALFGPSGAGKTTVLEAVAGLVDPRCGSVVLDGRILWRSQTPKAAVPAWDRGVALVRQDPGLFPHLNVRDNLRYAPSRVADAEIDRLVGVLGLGGLLHARPGGLSGGQAHRVALARALAQEHRVLLLDEPYTGLDAALRRQVTALVREETAARGVPAVLVSHELEEAQAFADRIGVIDRGRLLQVGSPRAVVLAPGSRRVAELVGYRSFLPHDGAVLGIHPERVRAGAHPDTGVVLTARLVAVRPAGTAFEADLDVGGVALTARLDGEVGPLGSTLQLTALDPPRFDPATGVAADPRPVLA